LNSVIKLREVDIEKIPGVGEKRKEALKRLGINTSYDLIYFFRENILILENFQRYQV